jgi:4-hydroxy-tetrahydrodipicolinate reductase
LTQPTNIKKKIWIHGFNGRMGTNLQKQISESDIFQFIGGSDSKNQPLPSKENQLTPLVSDIILDFTSSKGNQELLEFMKNNKRKNSMALLIGSTGLNQNQITAWESIAKVNGNKVLLAPNTSLGCLLALKSALSISGLASANNFDIEIIETHHKNKIDQPSGTALHMANQLASSIPNSSVKENRTSKRVKNEIGIHAVRGGGVVGEHQIRFISEDEEVSISHRAFSRDLFAKGALILAKWLVSKPAGFYQLEDVDL